MIWVALYIIGAVISYFLFVGWDFAFFQGIFPDLAPLDYESDKWYAYSSSLLIAPIWPLGIFLSIITSDNLRYGWKFPVGKTLAYFLCQLLYHFGDFWCYYIMLPLEKLNNDEINDIGYKIYSYCLVKSLQINDKYNLNVWSKPNPKNLL